MSEVVLVAVGVHVLSVCTVVLPHELVSAVGLFLEPLKFLEIVLPISLVFFFLLHTDFCVLHLHVFDLLLLLFLLLLLLCEIVFELNLLIDLHRSLSPQPFTLFLLLFLHLLSQYILLSLLNLHLAKLQEFLVLQTLHCCDCG